MRCAYSTNIGIKRKTNQDAYLVANLEKNGKICYIFAVADGLGGHNSGEVASEMTVEYLKKHIGEINDYQDHSTMKRLVNDINWLLIESGHKNPFYNGMATTLVLAIVIGDELNLLNVGDSRAYKLNNNGMIQLTKDHSLVQALVDEGKLTSEQAKNHPQKNVITRALGTDDVIEVDLFYYSLVMGDRILLCSDGLYNMVPEEEIWHQVMNHTVEDATENLINIANANGGTDNITLIIFDAWEREHKNER